MEDILKKITQRTAQDLALRQQSLSVDGLKKMQNYNRPTLSLYKSLKNGSGIIAEHKRQSPSKGSFNCPANLEKVVTGYHNAGASALSCLTDEPFFGGTLQDLLDARAAVEMPILRKDFMIHTYQVHEAKAYGADAILLIAACLDNQQMQSLGDEALNIGLEILFEVHNLEELQRVVEVSSKMPIEKYVIGVNNRDLKRFKTDIQNSKDLLPYFPKGVLAISESGISNPEIVKNLKQLGYHGFLIGENFMKTDHPGDSCAAFIRQIQ